MLSWVIFYLKHVKFLFSLSILYIYKNFKKMWENNNLPSMNFLYRKVLFKIVFGQKIFICQPIFLIFRKTKGSLRQRKCFVYTKKNLENNHNPTLEMTH